MDLRLLKQACCLIKQARNISKWEQTFNPAYATPEAVFDFYANDSDGWSQAAEQASSMWGTDLDQTKESFKYRDDLAEVNKELGMTYDQARDEYRKQQLDDWEYDAMRSKGKLPPIPENDFTYGMYLNARKNLEGFRDDAQKGMNNGWYTTSPYYQMNPQKYQRQFNGGN